MKYLLAFSLLIPFWHASAQDAKPIPTVLSVEETSKGFEILSDGVSFNG